MDLHPRDGAADRDDSAQFLLDLPYLPSPQERVRASPGPQRARRNPAPDWARLAYVKLLQVEQHISENGGRLDGSPEGLRQLAKATGTPQALILTYVGYGILGTTEDGSIWLGPDGVIRKGSFFKGGPRPAMLSRGRSVRPV